MAKSLQSIVFVAFFLKGKSTRIGDDTFEPGFLQADENCAGVACAAGGPCKKVGTCDPNTLTCSQENLDDGTRCIDTDPNTILSTCVAGKCRGCTFDSCPAGKFLADCRGGDANCTPCTNKPAGSEYTGPATNFGGLCPYRIFGGTCENGELAAQSSRIRDNQCGKCNNGAHMVNISDEDGVQLEVCALYPGTCANGESVDQSERNGQGLCKSCNAGFHLVNQKCVAYTGNCQNGVAKPLANRTADDQCAACNVGAYAVGARCVLWAGNCANGMLVEQTYRTRDNQCGSCNENFILSGDSCTHGKCDCKNGGSSRCSSQNYVINRDGGTRSYCTGEGGKTGCENMRNIWGNSYCKWSL
eukprot:TRINITY_DN6236_c0_g1_i1.p1 TRINITY_DN6236_c0_g1~~TRINITY_DN6236_c0_g1_i1.p1  ORF type:complete len:358 (-),score=27.57 TRINITY_DN6236_c0_g1_i1:269-1342(-)